MTTGSDTMDNGVNESNREGASRAHCKLREELLLDGLVPDFVSLSLVNSRVHQHYPTAPLSERQAVTLDIIHALISEGLFELGDQSGANGRFAAFNEPLDESMQKIRDAYVTHYDDKLGWVYRFWLNLTDNGKQVATSTQRGQQIAQEAAESIKRAQETIGRAKEERPPL